MKSNNSIYDIIINILKTNNQLSISGLTRELQNIGIKEHRLVVTGYLRALRDVGIVEELNIKPSKVYILK